MSTKRILLVGREGNGKSSCISSIAKRPNHDIIAKKCIGVGDTGEDLTLSLSEVEHNVERAIKNCGGFNAIVFVLKFGTRFTRQEKNAVDAVKTMLGYDVFLKYGIIMMTYGDLFEEDNEDDGRNFRIWCGDQTGDITTLFQEVNHRIVLFDNKTSDISKLEDQYDKLYTILSSMTTAYGIKQFEEAKFLRVAQTQKFATVKEYTAIEIPENNNRITNVLSMVAHLLQQHRLMIAWLLIFATLILLVFYTSNSTRVILACAILWAGFGILLYRYKLGDFNESIVHSSHYGNWYLG